MQFRQFFVQMGPGTHVGPFGGTDGAKVPGHIGRAATRGEQDAVRGGKHGPATAVWEQAAICGAKGQTWAVSHVFRVCTCLLVRSMDDVSYSKYSFNHDVQDVAARLQPVSSLQTDWCHVLHQSWPTSSTLSVVELQTRRELTPVPLVASESHMVSSATRPSESGRSLGNVMPVHGGQKVAGSSCGGRGSKAHACRMPHGEELTRERGGWSWT